MMIKKYEIKRKDLLYPELSFIINGVLIDVSKQLGGGHPEKYYQKAVGLGLTATNIKHKEQLYVPLQYKEKIIGKYFLDFLINDCVVLEIKRGQFISATIIKQVKSYLTALKLKLAIIACFTHQGVVIKRIINEY